MYPNNILHLEMIQKQGGHLLNSQYHFLLHPGSFIKSFAGKSFSVPALPGLWSMAENLWAGWAVGQYDSIIYHDFKK